MDRGNKVRRRNVAHADTLIEKETLLKVIASAGAAQASEAEQRRQHLGGGQTCFLDRAAN